MEKDDEVKGEGNSYTTYFRQLDPRVGRWFTIDPVFKADQSSYISMSNNPITRIDPKGDDDFFDAQGNYLFSTSYGDEVRIVRDLEDFAFHMARAYDVLKDTEDANEEKLTKILRWEKYTTNITQYKFKSNKPPSKILTHYGRDILPEDKIINASNSYGGLGVMSTGASKDRYVNNRSNKGNLLGLAPQIYTPLVANKDNGEVGFIVDQLLNTISNITSTIVHENYHLENHVKYYSDGLYEYLNVETGLSGVMNHLKAYDAQINDSNFSKTTDEYKKNTAVNISILINKIKDEKIREGFHKQYEEKLDNYDRTYTKDNYYQRAKADNN